MRLLVCFLLVSLLLSEPPGAAPPPPGPEASAWLGVFLGDALDGGVELVAVAPGGPAQRAGLRAGDLLLRLNGRPVGGRDSVRVLVESLRPGDSVLAEILRSGRVETRRLETAQRRGSAWIVGNDLEVSERGAGVGGLGLAVVAIPEDLRVYYGAPADAGVLVARVEDGGAAGKAGVVVGDVLVRVDATVVRGPESLDGVASGAAKVIEVVRRREPRVLKVAPRRNDTRIRQLQGEIADLRQRILELERKLNRLRGEE